MYSTSTELPASKYAFMAANSAALEMADGGKIYMDCNLEKPRTAPVRVSFEGVLDAKRMKSRVGRIVCCRPSDE